MVALLMWWAHRVLFGRMRSPAEATSGAATTDGVDGRVPPIGLDDDPRRWDADRHTWDALDEHQLTRLLRESAPIEGTHPTTDLDTPRRN
ncbi:hypothetical protein [Mycolicibacterium sp.]|uniref:hypothetical protein n=1 Tax=Mycolicibacterium sp. TaxID=2320850 RepID=UPI001A361117|nr:hypothetical protein [Mycolicibacterium sp.]MBJ7336118.1 hypothetical protein [Mycolicibacterium sp.]